MAYVIETSVIEGSHYNYITLQLYHTSKNILT